MTYKECYRVLGLKEGATLTEIKQSYRKLAFALHPDLNPQLSDASRRFQALNEAYVTLSQIAPDVPSQKAGRPQQAESAKAREDAQKAYKKAQGEQKKEDTKQEAPDKEHGKGPSHDKEKVLKDILKDPFARRVFEDIYSHIHGGAEAPSASSAHGHDSKEQVRKKPRLQRKAQKNSRKHTVVDGIKSWLRKQIDDEQTLHLPGDQLLPGARVRLQVQHGFTEEPQTVELTLPDDFKPGKAMRLKGMGKRVGSWRGDLYVRIEPE